MTAIRFKTLYLEIQNTDGTIRLQNIIFKMLKTVYGQEVHRWKKKVTTLEIAHKFIY